jgi:acyl-CoA thioesterase I
MQIPPNLGISYARDFKNMYKEIAKEKKVALIPFFLEGVAADPKLNLPDMIHPNEA